jgi:hypothetical protein
VLAESDVRVDVIKARAAASLQCTVTYFSKLILVVSLDGGRDGIQIDFVVACESVPRNHCALMRSEQTDLIY